MGCIEFSQEQLERASDALAKSIPFDPLELAAEVARRWGTTCAEMLGKQPGAREKHLSAARAELYADLRELGWSYPAIGRFCGKRDHTTVMYALRGR